MASAAAMVARVVFDLAATVARSAAAVAALVVLVVQETVARVVAQPESARVGHKASRDCHTTVVPRC